MKIKKTKFKCADQGNGMYCVANFDLIPILFFVQAPEIFARILTKILNDHFDEYADRELKVKS